MGFRTALDTGQKNLSEPGREGEFTGAKCVSGALMITSCKLKLEFRVSFLRPFIHHLN